MQHTTSARQRVRRLGQADLGHWIAVAEPNHRLWSVQKRICTSVSRYRSRTVVPSCNASGKTHLAARLALAFFDSFTPGTPCDWCGGPCRGAKVITTSSKREHLEDNLWGEIRLALPIIDAEIGMDGKIQPRHTEYIHRPDHFIIGQVADTAEGFQGYHAAHKLIIGDEAASVSDEVSQGITGLLASGDSRLLLILNPSTDDTYAARMARAPNVETIKITAFDTPAFTGEEMPPGANLTTPLWLEELEAQGMGPGSYEWTTRVLAEFWGSGDDNLITEDWYQAARGAEVYGGITQLGIDIAPYGTSENVIAVRTGNQVIDILTYPAMRPDKFFQGPVTQAIKKYDPDYVVYDADGVGSGAIGYAEAAARHMRAESQMIGFRGAKSSGTAYNNTRSAWWWNLRRQFEFGHISLPYEDPKLHKQLTGIHYSIMSGKIRVETKAEMKKRGVDSPDRGDALMYAFAMSGALEMPTPTVSRIAEEDYGVVDNSDEAMWDRYVKQQNEYNHGSPINAVLGVADDW